MGNRVVIVGGGTAGITCAAKLRKKRPGLEITLIDPAEKHYYQPLWTLVGGGILPKRATERSQKSLIPKGVRWLQERVSEFLPERNQVRTTEQSVLDYDALIVAPGIQINWSQIKGLQEALGKNGVCSNYSYEYVESSWKFIQAFSGGRAIFTHPSTPIKCGGAPQKIMYLAEHAFRKKGIRDKSEIIFASAGSTIFGVPKYAKALDQVVKDRGIQTLFRRDLTEILADRKEALFKNLDTGELETLQYDLLHVTPPMSAPDFIRKSPLANASGWIDVEKFTLQHLRYPNVFGLGDASSLPTSKTGAAIRKQAPVVVQNLLSCLDGKTLSARYDGYTSCPLVTAYGKVILAEFDYDGNPVETFPVDQGRERYSMYLVKRHLLPVLYWSGMLKGRA